MLDDIDDPLRRLGLLVLGEGGVQTEAQEGKCNYKGNYRPPDRARQHVKVKVID
jgi:hypothetical protein